MLFSSSLFPLSLKRSRGSKVKSEKTSGRLKAELRTGHWGDSCQSRLVELAAAGLYRLPTCTTFGRLKKGTL
jgi:hypothetical protein